MIHLLNNEKLLEILEDNFKRNNWWRFGYTSPLEILWNVDFQAKRNKLKGGFF